MPKKPATYVAWFTLSTGGYALHKSDETDPDVLAEIITSVMDGNRFFRINNGHGQPEILNRDHVVKVVIKEDDR